MKEFVLKIREPALYLVKTYLCQALLTFSYIYSLACVGKIANLLPTHIFEPNKFKFLQGSAYRHNFVVTFLNRSFVKTWPFLTATVLERSARDFQMMFKNSNLHSNSVFHKDYEALLRFIFFKYCRKTIDLNIFSFWIDCWKYNCSVHYIPRYMI